MQIERQNFNFAHVLPKAKPHMEESQGLRPDWKGAERIAVRQWSRKAEPWKAVLRLRFVCKKCSPQKEKLPSKRDTKEQKIR